MSPVAAAKVGTYAYVNPVIAAGRRCRWRGICSAWLAAGVCVILLGVFLVRGGERRLPSAVPAKPDEDGISDADWQIAQASEPS